VITDEELELCRRVAASVARRFHGFVELDDVEQECRLWILEHQSKVQEWRSDGRPELPPLVRALTRRATQYAKAEQAAWRRSVPRAFRDDYTPQQVRLALPMALDDGHAEGSETLQAVVADIKVGLEQLSENDHGVLRAAADFDFDYEAIATAYTDDEVWLTKDAAEKRVSRAIHRLARAMNADAEEARRNAGPTFRDIARYSNADIIALQGRMGEAHDNPGSGDGI
jgi:hypothetical protein